MYYKTITTIKIVNTSIIFKRFLRLLCDPSGLLPIALSEAITDLFYVIMDECAFSGVLYKWNCTICTAWLLSLSIIILRLINAVACMDSSILLIAE